MFRAATERRGSFVTLISSAPLSFKIFFSRKMMKRSKLTHAKMFRRRLIRRQHNLIYAKAFARFLTASFIDCYTSDIPSSSSGGNILRASSGPRSMFFARKQIIFNQINGEINFYFAIVRKFLAASEWSLMKMARIAETPIRSRKSSVEAFSYLCNDGKFNRPVRIVQFVCHVITF